MTASNTAPILCGVYTITCAANNKSYVGSSLNIKHRWQQHVWDLTNGKASSHHMQRCWDKYGKDSFKFNVVETTTEENRVSVEQSYIDTGIYELNSAIFASCPMKGRTFSVESRAKISASNTGKKASLETRKKMSLARTGRKYTSQSRAKMRVAQSLVDPKNKRRGSDHYAARSVVVRGQTYNTCSDAAEALGIKKAAFGEWLQTGKASYLDGSKPKPWKKYRDKLAA